MDARDRLAIYGEPVEWSQFAIVTLHPLADEGELLVQLDVAPDECDSCDIYWAQDSELVFVSVVSSEAASVNLWRRTDLEDGLTFLVRTRARPLTTFNIEAALSYLAGWLASNSDAAESAGDNPQRISEIDVAE